MPDPGTKFPSFDGASPGEVEDSEDITGMPLPKVSDEELPETLAGRDNRGSTISHIPGRDSIDRDEERDRSSPERVEPQDDRRSRRTARDRIAQLTRRMHAEKNENSALQQELEQVRQQLKQTQETISSFRRAPQTGPSTSESYGESHNVEGRGQGFDPDMVRQVVSEALAPINRRFADLDAQNRLQQEQQASYQDAVREFPELADPKSEAAQAFQEIWAGSRLRQDPDGPLNVAYMVRGVLADEARERPVREARKRAASVVQPGPRNPDTQAPPEDVGARKVLQEALSRFRDGADDPDTYIAARKAARRTARRFKLQY